MPSDAGRSAQVDVARYLAIDLASSISGGAANAARGYASSVSGGEYNEASGNWTSVSGGHSRQATAGYNWRAGDLFQPN
jgi:trimeric autotransporter adhesin